MSSNGSCDSEKEYFLPTPKVSTAASGQHPRKVTDAVVEPVYPKIEPLDCVTPYNERPDESATAECEAISRNTAALSISSPPRKLDLSQMPPRRDLSELEAEEDVDNLLTTLTKTNCSFTETLRQWLQESGSVDAIGSIVLEDGAQELIEEIAYRFAYDICEGACKAAKRSSSLNDAQATRNQEDGHVDNGSAVESGKVQHFPSISDILFYVSNRLNVSMSSFALVKYEGIMKKHVENGSADAGQSLLQSGFDLSRQRLFTPMTNADYEAPLGGDYEARQVSDEDSELENNNTECGD